MQAIFTEDGIPRWFGPDPVEGSVPLDLDELRACLPDDLPEGSLDVLLKDFLVTHCRVDGKWLPRPVRPEAEEAGPIHDETVAQEEPAGVEEVPEAAPEPDA